MIKFIPAHLSLLGRMAAVLLGVLIGGAADASQIMRTGLEVNSLAQAQEDPNLLYAGASIGVFRSRDHGRHWEPLKLPVRVRHPTVVTHPEQAGRLFVLFDSPELAYYESTDAGTSWVPRGAAPPAGRQPVGDPYRSPWLQIDLQSSGGAWWTAAGGHLLRSRDKGRTWTRIAEASRLYRDGRTLLRVSENGVLYSSQDHGDSWGEVYTFAELQTPRTKTYGFMILPDGGYMVHTAGLWQHSTDGGAHWSEATNGFQALPDHGLPKSSSPFPSPGCGIETAPSAPASMLAVCSFSTGAVTFTLLYTSSDGGRHWTQPGKREEMGLPPWRPTAMLWDARDVRRLVGGWAGGGVYQTQDGGLRWERTDAGLRFRDMDDLVAFDALHEPALYQAVMYRDRDTLRTLLAAGTDINASGNYFQSVLEADLRAARWSEAPPASPQYFELRRLGARVSGDSPDYELVKTARELKREDILADLVDHGYNWQGHPEAGVAALDQLSDALRTRWLAHYVAAGRYFAADQVIEQLLTMGEKERALTLFGKISRTAPLDRQTGPATPGARIKLLAVLAGERRYAQARQLFAALPESFKQQARDALTDALSSDCDLARLRFFDNAEASFNCLSQMARGPRERLLEHMDARNVLTERRWLHIMRWTDYHWALHTPVYRRHAAQIEPLRGIVGINFQGNRTLGAPLLISSVLPDSPALQAGIRQGDALVDIDGARADTMNSDELVRALRGLPGSVVEVTVRRAGTPIPLRLTRRAHDAFKLKFDGMPFQLFSVPPKP